MMTPCPTCGTPCLVVQDDDLGGPGTAHYEPIAGPPRRERAEIALHPGVQGGKACIAGTRIPAEQVAQMWWDGMTVEDIAQGWPSLMRFGVADVVRVACWYMARHGTTRSLRRNYGEWAQDNEARLWSPCSHGEPSMPPRAGDEQERG